MDAHGSFGRLEEDAGGRRAHLVGIERAGLLHGELPQVDAVVRHLHRIADHAVLAVTGFEGLDETLVGRILEALEIAHACVVANRVVLADAFDFVLGHHGR